MSPENGHSSREVTSWSERSRVMLQPIAAPSILGLYGFAGATFMVAADLAWGYGGTGSELYLFPFAAFFGGLAQFLAGMWAYRARDALATAMHGMWGAFWMAFGLLYLLAAVGALTLPPQGAEFEELAYWFLVLAAITGVGAVAAIGESIGLVTVLAPLSAGAAFLAIHEFTASTAWGNVAGYTLVGSAVAAFYVASAMLLEESFGKTMLPLGKYKRDANIPGRQFTVPLEFERGEPGVRQGQ